MAETNTEVSIVETLRSKTEQSDMKQYLKSTLGGYTKKSVLEYLSELRKQQQATADTFSRNQQALFDEKENLKKENESLKYRLNRAESEYRNISEAIRSRTLDEGDLSAADIAELKNKAAALEEELNKSGIEKSKLEKKIEQQNSLIEDHETKLQQAGQEKAALKEMLKAEMQESKNQRTAVARLSGIIEEKEEEIKFLNSLISTGQVANLTEKINGLMQQIEDQTGVMANLTNENGTKSQEINTLSQENETLKQTVGRLTKTLESFSDQNDKLLFANKTLSDQLENEYKRSIALIKEKAGISVDKLTAVRKLDEASIKITMLEQQLQKQINSSEKNNVYKSAEQTDELKSVIS